MIIQLFNYFRKILRRQPELLFFSNSKHTFVKGTKDSNKVFLRAQVSECIGTIYLFLIYQVST